MEERSNFFHWRSPRRFGLTKFVYLGRYRPAAATYALTQASFEEVALKFIQVSEQDPLKVFLVKKLNNMDYKVCGTELYSELMPITIGMCTVLSHTIHTMQYYVTLYFTIPLLLPLTLFFQLCFLSKDKSQITMITMWLIELYLNELGELRDGKEEKRNDLERVQDDFRKLLATSKVKVEDFLIYIIVIVN